MQKVIVCDYTYFQHQSIFSRNNALVRKEQLMQTNPQEAQKMFIPPSTYTVLSSLIGALKKVGINDENGDIVILAVDSRHSWRKDVDPDYKGKRGEQRKQASFVNWEREYEAHNNLLDKINNNLPFWIISAPNCEADDIISVTCRFFNDKQVIIVSPDKDFFQLLTLDNVKVFSPHPHPSVKKCPYRILDLDREKEKRKAYKSLIGKIRKETSDDLTSEISNELQFDDRKKIVDLLQIPKFIVNRIKPQLEKIVNIEKINFNPEVFSPGIQNKLSTLYSQDSIITWDDCYKKLERKLNKKRKEKKSKIKLDKA